MSRAIAVSYTARSDINQALLVSTFPVFFKSIKLTQVVITNYGIIIKNIGTIMCTVLHIDKYKITFKLVTSSRRISRCPAVEKHWSRQWVGQMT